MATLSKELVTQPSGVVGVAHYASRDDDATGIVAWQATVTDPYTVVLDDAVAAGEDTREEIEATLEADPTWTPV